MTNASQPPFPSRRELRAAQRAANALDQGTDGGLEGQASGAGMDTAESTAATGLTPATGTTGLSAATGDTGSPAATGPTGTPEATGAQPELTAPRDQTFPGAALSPSVPQVTPAVTSDPAVSSQHPRLRLRELGDARGSRAPGATRNGAQQSQPRESFSLTLKPSKKSDGLPAKTPGQRLLSIGTMIAAPLLLVGVSMPVNLFYGNDQLTPAIANEAPRSLAAGDSSQPFVASSSVASVEGIRRESWSVTSYAEVLRAKYGGRALSYETSGQGPVRWPFPVAVQISSGFGARVAPCRYCSSYHRGVDFVPGRGAPIYAISDGVVTQQEFSGGYGEHAYIEHTINGQTVLSVYAHMESGSSPLDVGDRVEVGDFVGLVGNTGISTGPHLHFEVRIDGVYLDPFAYLQANAS